jgi:N-methylhydantoinase B/oxoprolinase/acetone carboxylase alpha subunit
MMDNETFQKLSGYFVEMKDKIDGVTAGQEELKNNMKSGKEELKNDMKSEISAVKNDISAVTDKCRKNDIENSIIAVKDETNAGQEELRQEIRTFQEGIESRQAEFQERVTRTVNTRLEDVSSMVEQQTRNLREKISRNIEATRDLETQLAAL